MNLWPHLYFLVQECMCVSVLLQAQPSGDYSFLGLRRCTVRLEDKGMYHYSKCITSWNYDSSGKVKIISFKIDENPDLDMPAMVRYHCAGWRKLLQELLLYHNTMAYSLGKLLLLPPFLLQLHRRCRRVDVAMAVARCCQKVQLE